MPITTNYISDNQKRREISEITRLAGDTRYWYYISVDYCPVCGSEDTTRERVYGPRPEKWEDRHEMMEYYDWCEG